MERTLEPELMDDREQAVAYARADFEAPHSRLIDLFRERFPDAPREARALDLGSGPGDVAYRFAAAYPGWLIDGVEGSKAMLEASEICRKKYPDAAERVRLFHGMIPEWIPPSPPYGVILSNSLLHHLHHPDQLWPYIRRWAAQGALLFIADLRRPNDDAEARRLTELYTQGEPAILKRDFFNSLKASFTTDELKDQLTRAGWSHLHIEEPSDRHVLIWGRL